jgi:hypothetical protein
MLIGIKEEQLTFREERFIPIAWKSVAASLIQKHTFQPRGGLAS